jgi:hypothetical protein
MKVALYVVAVLLILVGIIWILQGLNVLPGSFMSGQALYAVLGLVLDVIGVALLVFNSRRARIKRS